MPVVSCVTELLFLSGSAKLGTRGGAMAASPAFRTTIFQSPTAAYESSRSAAFYRSGLLLKIKGEEEEVL